MAAIVSKKVVIAFKNKGLVEEKEQKILDDVAKKLQQVKEIAQMLEVLKNLMDEEDSTFRQKRKNVADVIKAGLRNIPEADPNLMDAPDVVASIASTPDSSNMSFIVLAPT